MVGNSLFLISLIVIIYWYNPSIANYRQKDFNVEVKENYRQKGYNADAYADVKIAYKVARAYFTDYPTATISLSKLTSYGYVQTSGVNLSVLSGKKSDLKITSFHNKGTRIYTIDSDGNTSFQFK